MLDAALKETGTNLDSGTQESLINTLNRHLQNFCLSDNQNNTKSAAQTLTSTDKISAPSDIIEDLPESHLPGTLAFFELSMKNIRPVLIIIY